MADIPLLGEAASLTAAFCWAISITLFRGHVVEHGAWAVNLAKSLIATLLFGLTMLVLGETGELFAASPYSVGIIALSGIIGLTVGDTALFAAVARIGVHRTLLFQTLGPAFAAMLEIGFYGEPIHLGRLAGIAVVLAGVFLVISPAKTGPSPPAQEADAPEGKTRTRSLGYAFAVLAAFGQGAGIVLAKDGMGEVPIVTASFIRLLASVFGLGLVMAWMGQMAPARRLFMSKQALGRVIPPIVLGTYLAFMMMMAGAALAPASVATVLLGTTPIFSLFIDRWVVGTRITARGFVGTLIAIAGVALLAFIK